MPYLIGIDYGTKRIGLAVGDSNTKLASPLTTIQVRGSVADHARQVLAAIGKYDVDAFVVGLPVNMDGTEGAQVKVTRRFGDELNRLSCKPVHYWDERLSSFTADELLQPAELTRKKRKAVQDAVAAQVMLQSYLEVSDRTSQTTDKPPENC